MRRKTSYLFRSKNLVLAQDLVRTLLDAHLSSQIKKLEDDFKTARRIVRQGDPKARVVAVNGCCYGRDSRPDKGDYFKYCGQDFWELISGDAEFYKRIIEPLGHKSKRRNKKFAKKYAAVVNRLSKQFADQFCDESGAISWSTLVAFSSARA